MSLKQSCWFFFLILAATNTSPLFSYNPQSDATQSIGWDEKLLLNYSVAQLMIAEPPDDSQLQEARERTTKTVRQAFPSNNDHLQEPRTEDVEKFRLGLRARWLQLNLEYQAFLVAPSSEIPMQAQYVKREYDMVQNYLWFVPNEFNENGSPIDARDRQISMATCKQEDQVHWQEVRPFLDLVYHDISQHLPKSPRTAQKFVRQTYFEAIAPSSDKGINKSIRETVGKAFKDIQNLGKEAVAAKVQAAVVMRRFYGVTPEATRVSFNRQNDPRTGIQEVKLIEEQKKLFPDVAAAPDNPQWPSIRKMIEEVSAGGSDAGVVGNYRDLNLSIGENSRQPATQNRDTENPNTHPWIDALISSVDESTLIKTQNANSDSVKKGINKEEVYKFDKDDAPADWRKRLDIAYGVRGSNIAANDDRDDKNTMSSLRLLMEAANKKAVVDSDSLTSRVKGRFFGTDSKPANEKLGPSELDMLLAYEMPLKALEAIHEQVNESQAENTASSESKDALTAPSPPLRNRVWFQRLVHQPEDKLFTLAFDMEQSNKLVEASRIPILSVDRAYSSQLDVLVRRLASFPLISGSSAPDSKTENENQASNTETADGRADNSTSQDGIVAAKQSSGLSQQPISSQNDGHPRNFKDIHKRLLSRSTVSTGKGQSTGLERRSATVYEALTDVWKAYFPNSTTTESNDVIRRAVDLWLKNKFKQAGASHLLPGDVNKSDDNSASSTNSSNNNESANGSPKVGGEE
jgi:hypothetical protein